MAVVHPLPILNLWTPSCQPIFLFNLQLIMDEHSLYNTSSKAMPLYFFPLALGLEPKSNAEKHMEPSQDEKQPGLI